ncbi:MAG: GNAT family N-acetyltransferase [Candidatus Methylumidiphilus sp.]
MPNATILPFLLEDFGHVNRRLVIMSTDLACHFAEELARIEPWLSLGYSPESLSRYLAATGQERHAMALLVDDTPAACLTVRPNWLRGPLLELLAVLPEFQGVGLGREIIEWLAGQAKRERQGNLWTLCSDFNLAAQTFYLVQGFEQAGSLPDLICPDKRELLLRLRLTDRQT